MSDSSSGHVRLDVWLDVACIMPTRSKARAAIDSGHVRVNGERAKPSRPLHEGDEIELKLPGRQRTFVVRGLAERHIPKAEAKKLYEETTPPPDPEEIAMRRAMRAVRTLRPPGTGRPTKRDRRRTDRLRGD
jgi:ribosome-associated heat shock protein Hsp15